MHEFYAPGLYCVHKIYIYMDLLTFSQDHLRYRFFLFVFFLSGGHKARRKEKMRFGGMRITE